MISARAIWRLLVLPVYILVAGAIFGLALRNTAGSILSPLAHLAPWIMAVAGLLAAIAIAGGLLRWRRRLAGVRRSRTSRAVRQTKDGAPWDETTDVQPAARS